MTVDLTVASRAAWLAGRTPAPPDALAARIHDALAAAQDDDAAVDAARPAAWLAAAEAVLARVLADGATGTRSRDAALDLLAADALVTYAFEAAADAPARLPAVARDAIARLTAAR